MGLTIKPMDIGTIKDIINDTIKDQLEDQPASIICDTCGCSLEIVKIQVDDTNDLHISVERCECND